MRKINIKAQMKWKKSTLTSASNEVVRRSADNAILVFSHQKKLEA